jgi:hypothetical protein
MNPDPMDNVGYARRLSDKTRTTIKEQTIYHQPEINVKGLDSKSYSRRLSETARPTVKQTTIYHQPEMNVKGLDGKSYTRRLDDIAKPTIRQTTQHSRFIPVPSARDKSSYARRLSDVARVTNKQTTILHNYKGPASAWQNKPAVYDNYLNAETNDEKEQTLMGREPTKSNVSVGPNPEYMNVQLKADVKPGLAQYGNFCLDHNTTDILDSVYNRKKQHVPNTDYHYDDVGLDSLSGNPLVNNLVVQQQEDIPKGDCDDDLFEN